MTAKNPPFNTDLAHTHAINHRAEILASTSCGCFHCQQNFLPSTITYWVDEVDGIETTALCPHCGVDSVIGSSSGYPVNAEFLQTMFTHWFSSNASSTQ
ncbi:MAG: cytoplasmic protein [Pseudomonadota bacterium]